MSRFFSKKLSDLEAYTPGEQTKQGEFIKLNTNENPYPPPAEIEKTLRESWGSLQLYSDNQCKELSQVFAEYRGVSTDNVIFANGSDEILAFCFLAFCDQETGICYPEISYGFYEVFAQLFCVSGEKVPLKSDLTIDPSDYVQKGKTILIANPNAPTGSCLDLAQIEQILQRNPENLVIIDEAYVDFGGVSASVLCKSYENLLVCGTFSKSRNLAGARLGYAIGNEDLIADLNRIKYSYNPYNVNTLSQKMGIISIRQEVYFQECREKIMATREKFVAELGELGFVTLPSKANFVFTKSAKISGFDLFQGLKERKILVRHFTNPKISDFVRISIGTESEMEIVAKNIKELVE